MKSILNTVQLIIACFIVTSVIGQTEQKIATIGDLNTTNGATIKDCKVGYRTIGTLNEDKSNVVLWPTWFTGKSAHVISMGVADSLLDKTGLYIIIVDALTNGVSSSPSNTHDFPVVSIRDMVNSQYKLLKNVLGIDHVQTILGISMGGMQAFEWAVAYPDFMDQVIPIIGTPKQSSFDILVWQTMADIITTGKKDNQKLEDAYKKAHNILLMNMNTPTFLATTQPAEKLDAYLESSYSSLMDVHDYLGGIQAMIPHDIFKNSNSTPENIHEKIKAELLIIVASQDHLVNPLSAIELSSKLKAKLVQLESNAGHMSVFTETPKVKEAIDNFWNKQNRTN